MRSTREIRKSTLFPEDHNDNHKLASYLGHTYILNPFPGYLNFTKKIIEGRELVSDSYREIQ
ncbi:MAG: hypothetical protein PHC92_09115 [Syntrophomonadaceae bacterium]|nr:hypothetical protein [Syntrophomonadaceae bacterium]